jgi:hypothetical protein
MTPEQIAARFGCTVEQARAQLQRNADQLARMAAKANKTGKNVNGFTAAQLTERASFYRTQAQ